MRLACLVLVLLACPTFAEAQSIRVSRADLAEGRVHFGTLASAPVELVRWESPRRARIRFEDRAVTLEASLDLRAEGNRVLLGVGDDVAVVGGPWSITMRSGSWAPLVGSGGDGRPRVLLPRGLPMRRGTLARPVAPAGDPAPHRAFEHAQIDWERWSPICHGLTIRARADEPSPRWRLPPGSLVHVERTRGSWAVEAWVDGFVVHGHTKRRPPTCDGGAMTGRGLAAACMRVASGELRAVPAGTTIRVGGTVVATLRIDVVGRVSRDPIDIMHAEPGGASWRLVGTIDAPLESLAVVAEPPDDMRLCTDAIHWPED